jgi:hypothetical protein
MREHGEPNIYEKQERVEERPLIDEQKEQAFGQVIETFSKIQKDGGDGAIQETFAQMFSPALESAGRGELKPEDLKSLSFLEIHSKSASEVLGREIVRPAFIFRNIPELQNFSAKLQGEKGMSSRGFVIPGSIYPENHPFHKTGLLVATASNDFLSHEVRHTVDCNLENRTGADELLAELFAYYQKTIVETDLKGYRHLKKPEDGPWAKLGREATVDYEGRESEIRLSRKEYEELGQKAAGAARRIAEEHGHIEAQRAIIRSKTIEELVNYKINE